MRERPGVLTPVAAESIERVARRLLIELLQARGSRCRRCRTRSSRLTKKRRQGRGRQVPRLPRRIEAVPTFIFDIVGAEKASKVNFLDVPASSSKARARLRARGPAALHSMSEHIKYSNACIAVL